MMHLPASGATAHFLDLVCGFEVVARLGLLEWRQQMFLVLGIKTELAQFYYT
jgi:hypothetical protein